MKSNLWLDRGIAVTLGIMVTAAYFFYEETLRLEEESIRPAYVNDGRSYLQMPPGHLKPFDSFNPDVPVARLTAPSAEMAVTPDMVESICIASIVEPYPNPEPLGATIVVDIDFTQEAKNQIEHHVTDNLGHNMFLMTEGAVLAEAHISESGLRGFRKDQPLMEGGIEADLEIYVHRPNFFWAARMIAELNKFQMPEVCGNSSRHKRLFEAEVAYLRLKYEIEDHIKSLVVEN